MRQMAKTLTLVKSRDIVVDKLLKPCEDEKHSKCTGWAVLKKEISPIDGNYFLKCTCSCHNQKKKAPQLKKKQVRKKQLTKKVTKKKAKKKQKARKVRKVGKKSKRSKKARRR